MNLDRFNCLCYSAVLGFAIFVLLSSIKFKHEERLLKMKLESIEKEQVCPSIVPIIEDPSLETSYT